MAVWTKGEPRVHLFLICVTPVFISRNHWSCQLLNLCTPPVFSLFYHIMHQFLGEFEIEWDTLGSFGKIVSKHSDIIIQ